MHQNRISSFQWIVVRKIGQMFGGWTKGHFPMKQHYFHESVSLSLRYRRAGEPIGLKHRCIWPMRNVRWPKSSEGNCEAVFDFFFGSRGEFKGVRHERVTQDRAALFRPNPTANLASGKREATSCMNFRYSESFGSHERVPLTLFLWLFCFWIKEILSSYGRYSGGWHHVAKIDSWCRTGLCWSNLCSVENLV